MTLSVFFKLFGVASVTFLVIDLVWGTVLCVTVSAVTFLSAARRVA